MRPNKNTVQALLQDDHSMYHSNLKQNLKVNAALRSSLLAEIMECESQQSSPVSEVAPTVITSPPMKSTVISPLVPAPSDPFSSTLINDLLTRINFPGQHSHGFYKIFGTPRLMPRKEPICVGNDAYIIEKVLGKGTFGTVYKAIDCRSKEVVALKIQKPPNKWEYYICRELQVRLVNHIFQNRFMSVSFGYFSEYQPAQIKYA